MGIGTYEVGSPFLDSENRVWRQSSKCSAPRGHTYLSQPRGNGLNGFLSPVKHHHAVGAGAGGKITGTVPRLRLSVLDQSPIPEGTSASEAFAATLELARLADRLGY